MRQSGGKKGAPKNHKGHTLKIVTNPDEIKWHRVDSCSHCASSIDDVPSDGYECRQVFDLPVPRLVVTEHRIEKKCCPHCGTRQQAAFPQNVQAPVQYGDTWTAWCSYLNIYQHLPLERISQLFEDLTGHRPSEATLLSRLTVLSDLLEPIEEVIRKELLKSDVLHADETGLRIANRTQWLHSASNSEWTLYHVHQKRGKEAMIKNGILPDYSGILVHDCWASYFFEKFNFQHALCGAHLLRELQGIIDYDHHQWATDMQALLREAWRQVKDANRAERPVEQEVISRLEARYSEILQNGEKEWATPPDPEAPKKRGRKKKSKAANLGERFLQHKPAICRFLRDARVPFDNSQAERDVRMVKVKQKVSGAFRTDEGGKQFARIRGFISTIRKQKRDVLKSLIAVWRGEFTFTQT